MYRIYKQPTTVLTFFIDVYTDAAVLTVRLHTQLWRAKSDFITIYAL